MTGPDGRGWDVAGTFTDEIAVEDPEALAQRFFSPHATEVSFDMVVDEHQFQAMRTLLAGSAGLPRTPRYALTTRWVEQVPVVPRSGRRPEHIRRARWAAQRRLDSWRRRRNRRAGRPATVALERSTFIPAAALSLFREDRVHFQALMPRLPGSESR